MFCQVYGADGLMPGPRRWFWRTRRELEAGRTGLGCSPVAHTVHHHPPLSTYYFTWRCQGTFAKGEGRVKVPERVGWRAGAALPRIGPCFC
ncbi:hypothetical protein SKAU_G00163850 [Synaphobranchus kaupii]|uniref:Uncharacterized protein n=1 Tax=Synaphobranchus kaupii TaxID=118154 RepID=A0A9Q1FJ15_SYNKA|nr:hypothetical protein SKAU_G00163850 [Synaphobranchus kaupii]